MLYHSTPTTASVHAGEFDIKSPDMPRAVWITTTSSNRLTLCGLFEYSQKRPLFISFILHIVQPMSGIYNAVVFTSIPALSNGALLLACVNIFATLICMSLIDVVGRRRLFIFSLIAMIGAMSVFFHSFTIDMNENSLHSALSHSYVSAACVVVLVACYGLGLGTVPSIYTVECFKTDERGSVMAWCTFKGWSIGLLFFIWFTLAKNHPYASLLIIIIVKAFICLVVLVQLKARPTKTAFSFVLIFIF